MFLSESSCIWLQMELSRRYDTIASTISLALSQCVAVSCKVNPDEDADLLLPQVDRRILADHTVYTIRESANTGWYSLRQKLSALANAGPTSIRTNERTGCITVTTSSPVPKKLPRPNVSRPVGRNKLNTQESLKRLVDEAGFAESGPSAKRRRSPRNLGKARPIGGTEEVITPGRIEPSFDESIKHSPTGPPFLKSIWPSHLKRKPLPPFQGTHSVFYTKRIEQDTPNAIQGHFQRAGLDPTTLLMRRRLLASLTAESSIGFCDTGTGEATHAIFADHKDRHARVGIPRTLAKESGVNDENVQMSKGSQDHGTKSEFGLESVAIMYPQFFEAGHAYGAE